MDAEFGEELNFHLDRQVEANVRAGMSLADARRTAHLSLGNLENLREASRAARPGAIVRQLLRDAAYGVRLIRRSPAFALSAILIVALGVSATTAIFSVVYGVVLRPLPYREPDRLVNLWIHGLQTGLSRVQVTAADRDDWQASNDVFDEIALVRALANFNLTGDGEPERLLTSLVSPSLFGVLGVEPAFGRTFAQNENTVGHDRVVLLSDGFWRRRFGGDREIIGRTVALNGVPHTVIGVMRPDFRYPSREVQIWTPLTIDPGELSSRLGNNYLAVARLKSGVTIEQAQREMDVIARRIARKFPTTNEIQMVSVVPLHEQTVGEVRRTLFVLLGAVTCLLVIACLNLASLLAARTAARAREFAVRLALGASRGRLALQSIAEVIPIVGVGGMLGVATASTAVAAFVPLAAVTLPRTENIAVNVTVLLFSVATLVLTGLIGALLPAIQVSRSDFVTATREESRSFSAGPRESRSRSVLVIAQVALVLPLLTGASLLTRSFVALSQVDPGFRPSNLLSMQLAIPRSKYPSDRDVAAFSDRLVERVAAVPGVDSTAMVNRLPLAGVGQVNPLEFESPAPAKPTVFTDTRTVTPEYFRTMGIPLIEGRLFTEHDRNALQLEGGLPGAAPVVVVDERIARSLWPGQSAVGRRTRFPIGNAPWMEIIGVVGHVRHDGLDIDPRPQVYFNYLERVQDRMALVVRGHQDVSALTPGILQAIREVDLDQPVYDVRTMDDVVERSTAQRWLNMILVTMFASMALLLATVGVYGLVAYGVTRQIREFGIRMALGASRTDVTRLVVRRGATLAVSGVALGLIIAAIVTRAMQTMLFGVTPMDPVSLAVAAGTLVTVALFASYLPARQAASVDPAVTLRSD
jgi:putative ABC transport system permease protein